MLKPKFMMRTSLKLVFSVLFVSVLFAQEPIDPNGKNARPPTSEETSKYWLENMAVYHRFTDEEITTATGWDAAKIADLRKKFDVTPESKPKFPADRQSLLPYPGGRHPRIGFLDGAIRPQRDTKFSVFLPWDRESYVVGDIPEALWSNLGLTYLAHTHVPTIFDKEGVKLEKLEWDRSKKHQLSLTRKLPNGITFATNVIAKSDHVAMTMTLTNGTSETLSDLRVQNCIMLKAAKGFTAQTNENKRFIGPYVVCHDDAKSKWIITVWKPNHRPWGNAPCPCLHSDPKFPDCKPGKTKALRGWLSFYEGEDIDGEVKRIEASAWWE